MAKVSFNTADGEKSYTLNKYRSLQIGRDPGNDVVLRDARVSRHHAEIVFEKGFFILRDLSSANGSYINGKKIRVAPLIDKSELRLGSTPGSFSDDTPITVDDPSPTVSVNLLKTTARDQGVDEIDNVRDTNPHLARKNISAPEPPSLSENLVVFPEAMPPEAMQFVPEVEVQTPRPTTGEHFKHSLFVLDVSVPWGERSTVRDGEGKALLYYRRPVNLVGFVAGLVAGFIFLAGLAATIFLALGEKFIPAVLSLVLTAVFFTIVLLLIPRRHIYVFKDEAMSNVSLMLWQETRMSFPLLRFTARLPDGAVIASFTKSALSGLGRHRWSICDKIGASRIGYAVEDSFHRAVIRKFLGSFFGLLRTNFLIFVGGNRVGHIDRRTAPLDRYFLDLRADTEERADRRVALALAVLIDGLERK